MSTKKKTDIIPSESYYKHYGALMSPEIAAEFLYERYACINEWDFRYDVGAELDGYHTKGGGLLHDSGTLHFLRRGIRILEENGCATQKSGVWKIHERVYEEKVIGEGKDSVYLYYFRAERDLYPAWKDPSSILYPCNIGTTKRGEETRVPEKTKDFYEPPILALTMKTDKAEEMEKIIHRILIYNNRRCKEAKRTDWFNTTPLEVEKIFGSVETMFFVAL